MHFYICMVIMIWNVQSAEPTIALVKTSHLKYGDNPLVALIITISLHSRNFANEDTLIANSLHSPGEIMSSFLC